uniref:Uncharacterized protein n=1 Tax=Sander lucioperca TaxID=283035 RepID=A0A8D0CWL2_SANLU
SRDRGKEDYRKDGRGSDSKRRSSLDENRKRKVSCSSAESEYSRKSSLKSEYLGNSGSASKHVESRMRHDSSRWNSFDGGRYENKGWEEIRELEESSLTSVPVERPKKDLPSNLLDIFNQIAQFEKEKGVGPK